MGREREAHLMAPPAYDQFIKARYVFNLLDALGVISVPSCRATFCGCASPQSVRRVRVARAAGNSRGHVWDRKSSQPFITGARAAGSQGCAIKIMVRCCCIRTRRQIRRV
jgi:Glycyl-tRNA synthetase alpha subunit